MTRQCFKRVTGWSLRSELGIYLDPKALEQKHLNPGG